MIAANVATARFLAKNKMPTLYRVHDGPKESKLTDLHEFLGELGLKLRGGKKPEAKDYAELLRKVQERPDAHLIQTVMLRSLSQARYHPDNTGHFGLSHEQYLHFTSPIRRYPDLLVHRAIRHVLRKNKADGLVQRALTRLVKSRVKTEFEYDHTDMLNLGEHCSMTERRADEATRDAVDWLKCEHMLDKVGEVYNGIITSVTGFGLFVELRDIYVEGLVHITALKNDYYHFDPAHHRLRGEHTAQAYRLGDAIRVQVARVDLDERKIDFALADGVSPDRQGPAKKGRGGKGRTGKDRPAKEQPEKPLAAADNEAAPKPKKKRSRRRGPRKAKSE